jgi:hypothetical protein
VDLRMTQHHAYLLPEWAKGGEDLWWCKPPSAS